MSLLTTAGGGANGASEFVVTNSARFDRASADRLYFDQGSGDDTTARRKWTFSTWIKRSQMVNSSNHQYFFGVGNSTLIGFRKDDSGEANDLYFQVGTGSSAQAVMTNAKFRDPAAWMHIHAIFDSTQGTAANRLQLRINGNLVDDSYGDYSTDQRSSITQNDEDDFVGNNGERINIAYSANGTSSFFDGYMSETHLLIGTSKAYTEFAETDDDTGEWVPKQTSFATSDYGSNGFKLEYKQTGTSANASGIGADTSGNGNHFTVQNLNAQNVTTDTPDNNFCTINTIYKDNGNNLVTADFSQGATKMVSTQDGWKFGRGTFLLDAGKWYVEVKATEAGAGENGRFGLQPSEGGEALGNTDDNDTFEGFGVDFSGSNTNLDKLDTGSATTLFSNFSSGSIAMLALDLDNDKVWVGSNGTWNNGSASQSTTLDPSNHDFTLPTVLHGWVFGLGMTKNSSNNIEFEYNWGQPSFSISSAESDAEGHGTFEYAVPSGFFSCCTKNLAEYG